jgi:hypothetical protein
MKNWCLAEEETMTSMEVKHVLLFFSSFFSLLSRDVDSITCLSAAIAVSPRLVA